MGYGGFTLDLFTKLKREGLFDQINSVIDLGSQTISNPIQPHYIRNFLEAFESRDLSDDTVVHIIQVGSARFLFESIGVNYNCIDMDGEFSALNLDLNFSCVPLEHCNQYDLVTNCGTTEHIVNQLNCFEIIHNLTKPGGFIYHDVPFTGMLHHGLFNYRPELFFRLSQSNFYQLVGMWLRINTQTPQRLTDDIVRYTQDLDPEILENFRIQDGMISVLFRKAFDMPFVPPLQLPQDDILKILNQCSDDQRSHYWSFEPGAYEKIKSYWEQFNPSDPLTEMSHELETALHEVKRLRSQAKEGGLEEFEKRLRRLENKVKRLEVKTALWSWFKSLIQV